MLPKPQVNKSELLRVAFPSTRNTQQIDEIVEVRATDDATGAQLVGLKALALQALARNTHATRHATNPKSSEKLAQQTGDFQSSFVARESAPDSVALLRVSRDATTQQTGIRDRLVRLAASEAIDGALVESLIDAELEACAGLSDHTLTAYLRAVRDDNLREHGKCPTDETAAALCRRCGPVWLHPAVAACAPVAEGWPRVLGCAWCHVANRQAIPRPAGHRIRSPRANQT